MFQKIQNIIISILRIIKIEPIRLLYHKNSFLYHSGWFKSVILQESIDNNRNPLPWITYSCISFLEEKLNNNHYLLEYGSGNSSFWYATKVKSVHSIEHDYKWYVKLMKKNNVRNLNFHYQQVEDKHINLTYAKLAFYYDQNDNEIEYARLPFRFKMKFNVIVIDGIYRNYCINEAINLLAEDGVIIIDNAQYEQLYNSLEKLMKHGFKYIKFSGMMPQSSNNNVTAVFYKINNCFNI